MQKQVSFDMPTPCNTRCTVQQVQLTNFRTVEQTKGCCKNFHGNDTSHCSWHATALCIFWAVVTYPGDRQEPAMGANWTGDYKKTLLHLHLEQTFCKDDTVMLLHNLPPKTSKHSSNVFLHDYFAQTRTTCQNLQSVTMVKITLTTKCLTVPRRRWKAG